MITKKKNMKFPTLIISVGAIIYLSLLAFSSADNEALAGLIAPGATLIKVSDQFKFTEGPAVNKLGEIFFTDQPNDKIWKYSLDGSLSVFMEKTGRSNGLYFEKDGNLLACADEKNELWSIDRKGKITVLLKDFEGKKLNGPNDLWIDKWGGIYFTDPYYQRDYWQRKKPEIESKNVYYLPKGASKPVIVDSDLIQPNGIVGTPNGKHLFVADIDDKKTYKYDINKDGSLKNRRLFVNQGSDGMTLDNEGNLYLTGPGVNIYNKSGEKIGDIKIPSGWTGNICFGGEDRKTLFITASESVYTLRMRVKGVE